MSALDLLRNASKATKPYLGFSKLPHGYHEIVQFRLTANKMYNPKEKKSQKRVLLIELKDQVLFLPEYFVASLGEDPKKHDEKVDELNADSTKKFLFFDGARANK